MSRVEPVLGSALSPAEVAVIGLITEGWSYAETAHALGIKRNTVRSHMGSILARMGAVSSLHAAVLWTRREMGP